MGARRLRLSQTPKLGSTLFLLASLATAQTISEFPIPTSNASPNGITLGPDGNLWFTENGGYNVSRITPAGAVSEFGTASCSCYPSLPGLMGITVGGDGNLWFTEGSFGKVGMMTAAGAYQFAVNPPSGASVPFGIVSGNDGNLWFTESGTGKLGRLTPGQFTVFEIPIPTPNSDPRGITSGPDSAIWFVEYASTANQVGRRSFAGTFTEYPIPTANSNPLGITSGPDGNLWFTESSDSANKIGRLNPTGTFTEFVIPTSNSGASSRSRPAPTEISGSQKQKPTRSGEFPPRARSQSFLSQPPQANPSVSLLVLVGRSGLPSGPETTSADSPSRLLARFIRSHPVALSTPEDPTG